jgi:hypothetical protein
MEPYLNTDNRIKGSKRGAGAIPGVIIGIIAGSLLTVSTGSIVWAVLFPFIGMLLGGMLGKAYFTSL